ncbi:MULTISPECIES: ABC transporter permease [Streptomycetaceae]|uniref:Binding-protein-dependent transport systems inner membrane component n=1 Tax=Streptantibioticus cattleyicolor (strain ATCC 35852 / DSM 46488 / JCM 4925 / NBRC 14057 / NRRL 8057) TaxID=1003195 RepID=F8JVR1_STREN|nr:MULTISPECIES: ABC transporter permease [Streptomycetaceae]AEW96971.1 binding-protein-dependent transport systems inner membrane component [Streptantibioticus cattleyicolor NRRL 8057 = DSM 46488]MYS61441.1 ABC transporter permease subunit [Streptomyces sp. SID5468]CCB77298.1 Binding-protein-dependent transport systems inner membrane component [Streptantibioticus cattleyicolor NRRL 8057 = DSM 46488]
MATGTLAAAPGAEADETALARTAASRRRRRGALVHTVQALLVVVVVGGWQLASARGALDTFTYGSPGGVVHQLKTWFTDGTPTGSIWYNIGITMEETVLGFLIGTAAGVVLGVALGRVQALAEVLAPFIKAGNSIPRVVLGSMFIIWFGLGPSGKVALAVVLVFFSVFFNAFQGTREVDRDLIANARVLGASPWRVTSQVVLPSAMTWIVASLHAAFGFALIGAIVGEVLGAQAGLGQLIQQAQQTFNANGVYAGIVVIAVLALAAEFLITRFERRVLRWRPTQLAGDSAGL